MKSAAWICSLVFALFGAASCNIINNCNRDGCDAIGQSRSDYTITRGIGGYVAASSDEGINGCQKCGFSSTVISIWTTTSPVLDAATAQSTVNNNFPAFTVMAVSSYEKELDSGNYLICSLPGDCAAVTITEVGVFTINVELLPQSSMTIFEPGSNSSQSGGVFHFINSPSQEPIPSAPINVSATGGNGQNIISWSSATGAGSYNIYWSTASGVTKSSGIRILGVSSPYAHNGLSNGTTYYYVVTAMDNSGESSESAEVSAIPSATTP